MSGTSLSKVKGTLQEKELINFYFFAFFSTRRDAMGKSVGAALVRGVRVKDKNCNN